MHTTTTLRWCADGPWAAIWRHTDHGLDFAGFHKLDDETLNRLHDLGAQLGTDGIWESQLTAEVEEEARS